MKNGKFGKFAMILLLGLLMLWAMRNNAIQQEQMEAKAALERERAALDSAKAAIDRQREAEAAAPAADTSAADTAAAAEVAETPRRVFTVETDRFWVDVDSRGATVRSLRLKALRSPADGSWPELLQRPEEGLLGLEIDGVDLSGKDFSFDGALPDTLVARDSLRLSFSWSDGRRRVERVYAFSPEADGFAQELRTSGFRDGDALLRWDAGLRETEPVAENSGVLANYFFSEVVMNQDYSVARETPSGRKVYNEDQGRLRWVGLRRKYAAGVVRFAEPSEHKVTAVEMKPAQGDASKPTWQLLIREELDAAGSLDFDFDVFPLEYSRIKAKGQNYENILFSGWEWCGADVWFVGLTGLLLRLLNFFYGILGNYGLAIVLLTLIVRFATLPLTLKQMRSMRAMQEHQPALNEIRKKYRDDPRKMQLETMAYYRKAGINPLAQMAGCFPMLLQMPVFIALFFVLGRAVELRDAPFALWIRDLSMPDIVTSAVHIPLVMPMGICVLPFVMALTTFFQTRQSMTDPNQKMMVYIMPLMMFGFSGMMPSGLVLYWIVSNLFGIVQYAVIGSPARARAAAAGAGSARSAAIDVTRTARSVKKGRGR